MYVAVCERLKVGPYLSCVTTDVTLFGNNSCGADRCADGCSGLGGSLASLRGKEVALGGRGTEEL
jgi:hypothetical protein